MLRQHLPELSECIPQLMMSGAKEREKNRQADNPGSL